MVVSGKRGNAELIVAVDEAAERLGLAPGLALAQARAMHPAIEAIEEDAEADAALLENIADWCLRYTPLVACDAPDGLLLDISGCAHLYGGEHALVADLGGAARARRLCLSHRHRRHHRRGLGRRALRRAGKLCRRRGAQLSGAAAACRAAA